MRMRIDTADAGRTAGTDALLEPLVDDAAVSLGVLAGADLCLLGATEYPVCSGELRSAWWELGKKGRGHLSDINTLLMLRRGLIKDPPARGDRDGLTDEVCFPMSAELSIILGARQSPAFISATQHASRTPAFTYFPTHGTCCPLLGIGAFVEEVPKRTGDGTRGTDPNPLTVNFSYRLLSPSRAVEELSQWVLEPGQISRDQPQSPRSICFFESPSSWRQDSCELVIRCGGQKDARVEIDASGILFDLDREELTFFIGELVAQCPK